MNNGIDSFKYWRKIFWIEIGSGIPYPQQKDRWPKYGEPLSNIFSLFFDSLSFVWFKNKESQPSLVGVNVVCLDSKFRWTEAQNDLIDIGLLAILSDKVNNLFTELGTSWAAVTGVFSHPDPASKVFVLISGINVPVADDGVAIDLPIYLIMQDMHPRKDCVSYISRHTYCRRLFGFPSAQLLEIIRKGDDVRVLSGFPSMKFGERENPIIEVLAEEMSYKQAVNILMG